jgi:hypothetical protein
MPLTGPVRAATKSQARLKKRVNMRIGPLSAPRPLFPRLCCKSRFASSLTKFLSGKIVVKMVPLPAMLGFA